MIIYIKFFDWQQGVPLVIDWYESCVAVLLNLGFFSKYLHVKQEMFMHFGGGPDGGLGSKVGCLTFAETMLSCMVGPFL